MSAALEAAVQEVLPPEEITYERYLEEFDTTPPEMRPFEILDGILHRVQSPNWRHQRIVIRVSRLFGRHETDSGRGYSGIAPFDLVIRRTPKLRTRQPDVFFITHERLKQNEDVFEGGPLHVAPELVVEVLSPSETPRSLRAKIDDFRSIGVQECWVVGPNSETVQVLRLTPESVETVNTYSFGETVQSVVFPDLSIATADIFAD